MTPPTEPLFTVETLAAYLGLSTQTIRNWRSSSPRKGPRAVMVGNQVRWRPEEVSAWLEANLEAKHGASVTVDNAAATSIGGSGKSRRPSAD